MLALAVLLFILSNQKRRCRPGSWLGRDFYSINVEMETAQAVTPRSQGQAAVISGINVGKVGASTLDNGMAKVRLDIRPSRDLIHRTPQFCSGPKTGLSDMVEVDRPRHQGSDSARRTTFPVSQRCPTSRWTRSSLRWTATPRTTWCCSRMARRRGAQPRTRARAFPGAPPLGGSFPFLRPTPVQQRARKAAHIAKGVPQVSEVARHSGDKRRCGCRLHLSASKENPHHAAQEAALPGGAREFPATSTPAKIQPPKSDRLSQLTGSGPCLGLDPRRLELRSPSRSSAWHRHDSAGPG